MAQNPQQTPAAVGRSGIPIWNSTAVAVKVRENRLRRVAERRGYTLMKSRRRDPLALDYGKYWLLDDREFVVHGAGYPELATLAEIEAFLDHTPAMGRS